MGRFGLGLLSRGAAGTRAQASLSVHNRLGAGNAKAAKMSVSATMPAVTSGSMSEGRWVVVAAVGVVGRWWWRGCGVGQWFGGAGVGASGGAGPDKRAVVLGQPPSTVGFQSVVVAAQGAEVVLGGGSVGIGHGVVEVGVA